MLKVDIIINNLIIKNKNFLGVYVLEIFVFGVRLSFFFCIYLYKKIMLRFCNCGENISFLLVGVENLNFYKERIIYGFVRFLLAVLLFIELKIWSIFMFYKF